MSRPEILSLPLNPSLAGLLRIDRNISGSGRCDLRAHAKEYGVDSRRVAVRVPGAPHGGSFWSVEPVERVHACRGQG